MTAVIYSNGSQECERMASLLKSLGGEFLEYKLNEHFTQRGFESEFGKDAEYPQICLLYTSPSPRDRTRSRMPSSA